jgi:hypothetical protein
LSSVPALPRSRGSFDVLFFLIFSPLAVVSTSTGRQPYLWPYHRLQFLSFQGDSSRSFIQDCSKTLSNRARTTRGRFWTENQGQNQVHIFKTYGVHFEAGWTGWEERWDSYKWVHLCDILTEFLQQGKEKSYHFKIQCQNSSERDNCLHLGKFLSGPRRCEKIDLWKKEEKFHWIPQWNKMKCIELVSPRLMRGRRRDKKVDHFSFLWTSLTREISWVSNKVHYVKDV